MMGGFQYGRVQVWFHPHMVQLSLVDEVKVGHGCGLVSFGAVQRQGETVLLVGSSRARALSPVT